MKLLRPELTDKIYVKRAKYKLISGLKWTFFGSATPCASPPPRPSIFSDYSFWVHHLLNRDDRHLLLANAMASDFSIKWQCLSKRKIVFSLRIKLHAKDLRHLNSIIYI
jgi:hypothetical protein